MRQRLERYFGFEALGTNWRTEILAGVTTFVTMAYIIFVNPSILREAGMPFTAVEIVFVFFFVDLFDNVGTLVAVGKRAGAAARLRS